jgi:hypothetical protein
VKRNKPLTQKAIDEYTVAWRQHNKECRRNYMHYFQFESLEEYIKYVRGQKYISEKPRISEKSEVCKKPEVKKKIPSHTASVGNCFKPDPKVYSGDRKLVGIATMHKSNMVPVFEDDEGDARKEATELANMRR